MEALKNYDPNIAWAKQLVRVTLMQWDYRATVETVVGGNCQGFEIFECAIGNAYDGLPTRKYDGDEYPHVVLTRADGDTLECEDEELTGEDWLKRMVVGIEIIGQEPESK